MEVSQTYSFEDEPTANRFLNDIRSGTVPNVKAKFHRDTFSVMVYFSSVDAGDGFDSRSSDLDDLARHYDGVAV